MADEELVQHAMKLLQSDAHYLEDARQGARVDNSIVGSVMSMTLKQPRQYTEEAVREALERIDANPLRQPPAAVRKYPVVDGTGLPTVLGMALVENEALAIIRAFYKSNGHHDVAEKITTARVTKIHTDQGDLIIEAWLGSTV